MILFGVDVSDSDRLISLQVFSRLPCRVCRSSTGSGNFSGYSFRIGDFNDTVRERLISIKGKNVSTQTCAEDLLDFEPPARQ